MKDAQPERIIGGAPEGDAIALPVTRLDEALELPQPVREHLRRVGQHLAGTPRGLGLGAEVLGEGPRAASLHPRVQGGERRPRGDEAGRRIGHRQGLIGHARSLARRGIRLTVRVAGARVEATSIRASSLASPPGSIHISELPMTDTQARPAGAGVAGTPAANQSGAHLNKDAFAEAKDFLPLDGIDHVEFWVGNARQASAYFRALWGFTPVAFSGLETGSATARAT